MNWKALIIRLIMELLTNLPKDATDEQIERQVRVVLHESADSKEMSAMPLSLLEELLPHIIAIISILFRNRTWVK